MALSRIPQRDEWKSVVLNRFFRISPQPELVLIPEIREHGF
jgi:hypothetical protein